MNELLLPMQANVLLLVQQPLASQLALFTAHSTWAHLPRCASQTWNLSYPRRASVLCA